MIPAKLEIIVKISQFPPSFKTVQNGWKQFLVDADGYEVEVTMRPKLFAKIEQANRDYPQWVAAISGKISEMGAKRIVLSEASVQVFERKPKVQEPIKPQEMFNQNAQQGK